MGHPKDTQTPKDPLEPTLPVLPPIELGYLAGLIDGEGSIYGMAGPAGFRLGVTVKMTHEPTIRALAARLGGAVTRCQVNLRARMPTEQWQWRVTGARAVAICRLLVPHLRIKTAQATWGVCWAGTLVRPGQRLTPAQQAVRAVVVEQLSQLNNSSHRRKRLARERAQAQPGAGMLAFPMKVA